MHCRRALPIAVALVATALAPAVAEASSVEIDGDVLVVRTDPGASNVMRIAGPNSGFRGTWWFRDVTDAGTTWTSLAPGCRNIADSGQIECQLRGGGVRVEAGGGDDTVSIDGETAPLDEPVLVQAGDGNDRINGRDQSNRRDTLDGGAGDDTLNGGDSSEILEGGAGVDLLAGNGAGDEVRGGEGDDKLSGDAYGTPAADVIDGGPGVDKLENEWVQASSTPPITVTLDGAANDGRPGESDNVVAVEDIYSTAPVTLTAGADPVIFKVFNTGSVGSSLTGGPGADRLSGFDWHDTINGLGGDDTIEGGFGNDTIDPGPGRDSVVADAVDGCNYLQCRQAQGNDTVQARDGEADTIDCGIGQDTVVADAADTVADSCETVDRGATGPPTGPGTGGPGPGTGGGNGGAACVVPKIKTRTTVAAARKRLKAAGCRAKVKRVRSRVRKGRVVGLSVRRGGAMRNAKAGTRLPARTTIVIGVSRGR